MSRISWVHPEIAARARQALLTGRSSWEEAFAPSDTVMSREPPAGIHADVWPGLAEHVARAERVREVIAHAGLSTAWTRFARSPHAVERAALAEARAAQADPEAAGATGSEHDVVAGVLACAIDEHLVYGHFLSRLVELGARVDPDGTVVVFERFVAAARLYPAREPSWPERLRVAEDGLASLYVRVDRADDAEALFQRRFAEEVGDATVAISAARAFLEHGEVGRAVEWLVRGGERAARIGRPDLAARLAEKADALRARMS